MILNKIKIMNTSMVENTEKIRPWNQFSISLCFIITSKLSWQFKTNSFAYLGMEKIPNKVGLCGSASFFKTNVDSTKTNKLVKENDYNWRVEREWQILTGTLQNLRVDQISELYFKWNPINRQIKYLSW